MANRLNHAKTSMYLLYFPELPQDLDETLKLALVDAEQVFSATTTNVREAPPYSAGRRSPGPSRGGSGRPPGFPVGPVR